MAGKINLIGRLNSYFFFNMYAESLMENISNKNAIDWCTKAGLLSESYECPSCKKAMQLMSRKDIGDKWEWSCSCKLNGKHMRRSIRKGTWFENSNLSLSEILLYTYSWVNEISAQSLINDIDCSSTTVSEWYNLCREVCMADCLKSSVKIGGQGRTVEIEECAVTKVKTSKKRKQVEYEYVLGGVERDTNKSFFIPVPDKTKACLLNVIEEWVIPGSRVVSDCWPFYQCLKDEDFQYLEANNGLTFVNLDTGARANAMEGAWCVIRKSVKGTKYVRGVFDGHLAEYLWRRKNRIEMQRKFLSFLEAIKAVYSPQTSDN